MDFRLKNPIFCFFGDNPKSHFSSPKFTEIDTSFLAFNIFDAVLKVKQGVCVCVCVCTYIFLYICLCMCVCLYVCLYECVFYD